IICRRTTNWMVFGLLGRVHCMVVLVTEKNRLLTPRNAQLLLGIDTEYSFASFWARNLTIVNASSRDGVNPAARFTRIVARLSRKNPPWLSAFAATLNVLTGVAALRSAAVLKTTVDVGL